MQNAAIEDAMKKEQSAVAEKAEDRLRTWNALDAEAAVQSILPCNGSTAWAQSLAGKRPFARAEELLVASDQVWAELPTEAQQEAFNSHPRIGERNAVAATVQSLQWSRGEQAASSPDQAGRAALELGNRAYEEKFGRIFIVCATGKSAEEMLAILKQRMGNDSDTELRAAAEEQRKITQLRLGKWLGMNSAQPAQFR